MNAKQRHGDKSHRTGWRRRLHHQQGAQRRQHQTDNNRRFAGFRQIVASARRASTTGPLTHIPTAAARNGIAATQPVRAGLTPAAPANSRVTGRYTASRCSSHRKSRGSSPGSPPFKQSQPFAKLQRRAGRLLTGQILLLLLLQGKLPTVTVAHIPAQADHDPG